jgi:GxxExxY protein
MTHNELAKVIVDSAFQVHQQLGPGLLEHVYEVILAHELRKRGLRVERQVPVSIRYDNLIFDEGFKADLIVEDLVLVEVKSLTSLHRVHAKQVLTYLRLTNLQLGLLINFGEELIKDGIKRVVNGLEE